MRWVFSSAMCFLPWWSALLGAHRQQGQWSWTETSYTMGHSKPFLLLFISVFCFVLFCFFNNSNKKLTNKRVDRVIYLAKTIPGLRVEQSERKKFNRITNIKGNKTKTPLCPVCVLRKAVPTCC
jgi:hypothetical protein